MKSGIYRIINLVNQKFYIGSSVNIKLRWYRHQLTLSKGSHKNPYLQNAYLKYGKDNFKLEILEFCETNKLIEKEQFYIDMHDAINKGYNICPFAYATTGIRYKQTEEHKRKIGLKSKGRKMSDEQKKKLSIIHTGTKLSQEHKQKISQSLLGNTYNLGKKASLETRSKMSFAHQNISDDTRQKLSNARKLREISPETGRKITLALTGKPHPHKGDKGRIVSEATRKKLSESKRRFLNNGHKEAA
jgi:group I intron endonuclease